MVFRLYTWMYPIYSKSKSLLDNTIQHGIMYIWYVFVQNSKHFWIFGTESSIIVSSHYIDIDLSASSIQLASCASAVCLSEKALEHWCWCQCIISLIWRKYHVHTWIYVPGCARHTPFRLISPPLFEFQSATVSSVYLLAYLLLAYLLACLHISTHPCMRPSVHASMNIPNWTVVMHQSIHLFIYQSICPSISSFFAFLNISHCISWSVLINRIMLN